jgi:hypothetical protein
MSLTIPMWLIWGIGGAVVILLIFALAFWLLNYISMYGWRPF